MLHPYRFAQAVAEDRQPGHVQLGQARHHLGRQGTADHRVLQRVIVDEHRGAQGLETCDPQRVEDAGPGEADVEASVGDVLDDLLLGVHGQPADLVGDLDRHFPAGQIADALREVLHFRRSGQVGIDISHPEDHRLVHAARLVGAPYPARAGAGQDYRARNQPDRRDLGPGLYQLHATHPISPQYV